MRGGHGVDLGANDRVSNLSLDVLSDHWYVLRRATFDYTHPDGTTTREVREAYDRGNGVTILVHDPVAGTVLLTRQFRLPVFLNGHPPTACSDRGRRPACWTRSGSRREAGDLAARGRGGVWCARRGHLERLFELFIEPGIGDRAGGVLHGATYDTRRRRLGRGGFDPLNEGEDIEVLELALDDALAMVEAGEIADGKTVILLQWAAMRGAAPAG